MMGKLVVSFSYYGLWVFYLMFYFLKDLYKFLIKFLGFSRIPRFTPLSDFPKPKNAGLREIFKAGYSMFSRRSCPPTLKVSG